MNIQKLEWNDAKKAIFNVNQELALILDKLKYTSKHIFYLLEYDYGKIIDNSKIGFQYPTDKYGKIWKTIPFSIVIDKKFEMFVDFNEKTFPFRVYDKGSIFNTAQFITKNRQFSPKDINSISAGARNTFLLPSIGDSIPHNDICNYFNINIKKPDTLDDQFFVFRKLSDIGKSGWKAKLLCFEPSLIEKIKKEHPSSFYNYIRSYNSQFDAYWTGSSYYDCLLSYIRSNNTDLKITNFMYDLIKQFYNIGCGQTPAYAPVVNDDFMPYKFIADIYKDIYKIKTIPFAMMPDWFKLNHKPVYYSFFKEGAISKPKKIINSLKLAVETKNIFQLFSREIIRENFYKNTEFRNCVDNLRVDVFSDRAKNYNTVLNSNSDLFDYDERFVLAAEQLNMNPRFYKARSVFFTGCFGLKY